MGKSGKSMMNKVIVGVLITVIGGVIMLYIEKTYFPDDMSSETPSERQPETPTPLGFQINYVYQPGGTGAFQLLADGGVLRSGDRYKIIFTPSEACYVYLFQTDSSGKMFGLFPLEHFKDVSVQLFNPVKAGKTVYVPAEGKSFELDTQRGKEKFYFLAFRTRDETFEDEYQAVITAQNQNKPDQLQAAQQKFHQTLERKGLARIVADQRTEPVTWQENGQNNSVLRQRLDGMCNGCIQTLTFTHQ